ncbi:chromate transporter [Bordetella genomosp. 13]|uniref:chromate transporter n=1 Tax=Bordetella genomosp. 13 TaxID=463040 RepID=UPI00119FE4A5|nr:chromate transporter [Bordetella genomosp. 13]
MSATLIAMVVIFTQLSLLAFGGGNTILPEMQRQVVEIHGWMSAADFSALFALSQAAPGPNLMIVPLVGWHVAGWAGMLVTSLAKFGPSSLVTIIVMGLWERFRHKPWRMRLQAGLVPVTAGMVAASAWLIIESSVHNWLLAVIAAGTAAASVLTRVHPLWTLAAGAVLGLAGSF